MQVDSQASSRERQRAPRLVRASTHLLLLTPLRLALGLAGLVAAALAGLGMAAAAGAFAVGTVLATVLLASDRRFQRDRLGEPLPLAPDARLASRWEVAANGVYPSTIGVAVLTVAALFLNHALAAFLAGILAGMGVAGIVSWICLDSIERRLNYRLYFEPAQHGRAYAGPR